MDHLKPPLTKNEKITKTDSTAEVDWNEEKEILAETVEGNVPDDVSSHSSETEPLEIVTEVEYEQQDKHESENVVCSTTKKFNQGENCILRYLFVTEQLSESFSISLTREGL